MRVIDARSGRELKPPQRVIYADGDGYEILRVDEEGPFSAIAVIVNNTDGIVGGNCIPRIVKLKVRWTHPRFFLQKVAFVET